MATKNLNNRYTKIKPYTIYILLHPHTKEFYIHYATTSSLRNAMKQHYNLNNIHTKDMFKEHRETIYPPEMYALEEKELNAAECFVKKILWIKYFIEKNYIPLNHQDDISSSENLFEENISDYELIKALDIEKIICRTTRRFPHYGRERKVNNNTDELSNERKQMKFYCSEEERNLIAKNAADRGQSLSAYMRDVSTNVVSVNLNYDAVLQHINEINQIKSELNPIISMLVKTNQAYPVDIEKIISSLREIDRTEKIMMQNITKERQQIRKYIKSILNN